MYSLPLVLIWQFKECNKTLWSHPSSILSLKWDIYNSIIACLQSERSQQHSWIIICSFHSRRKQTVFCSAGDFLVCWTAAGWSKLAKTRFTFQLLIYSVWIYVDIIFSPCHFLASRNDECHNCTLHTHREIGERKGVVLSYLHNNHGGDGNRKIETLAQLNLRVSV